MGILSPASPISPNFSSIFPDTYNNTIQKDMIEFSDKDAANMDIKDSDYAVSAKGMEAYVENLKAELIDNTYDKLKEIEGIKTAVDAGWNGPAKTAFLEKLEDAINRTYADMAAEHEDLIGRLNELQAAYVKQNLQIKSTIEGQD